MEGFNVTLASTLLDIDTEHDEVRVRPDGQTYTRRTGIPNLDRDLPSSLWQSGKVIGLSHVKTEEGSHPSSDDLVVALIATHLLDTRTRQSTSTPKPIPDTENEQSNPSIYLITAPSSTTISTLYTVLLHRLREEFKSRPRLDLSSNTSSRSKSSSRPGITSKKSTSSFVIKQTSDLIGAGDQSHTKHANENEHEHEHELESAALSLLERVHLLQYLDLIGLSESISEITQSLRPRDIPSHDRNTTTSNTTTTTTAAHAPPNDIIVVIEGLPQTLSRLVTHITSMSTSTGTRTKSTSDTGSTSTRSMVWSRTSQSASLLGRLTRNIRLLCRSQVTHGHNSTGVGCTGEVSVLIGLEVSHCTDNPAGKVNSSRVRDSRVLRTAFADGMGRTLQMELSSSLGPSHAARNAVVFGAENVLARILEAAVDTIVLVHDGFGHEKGEERADRIVEVVMDTTTSVTGGAMGSWAVWM